MLRRLSRATWGKKSVETCHDIVENMTHTVRDLADKCANGGTLENADEDLDGILKGDVANVIVTDKFEGLHHFIKGLEGPQNSISFAFPLVGSAFVVGCLLMAAMFRLRRSTSQAHVHELFADESGLEESFVE